jgi:pimeloyl-ACP methyl ester carboxylesterase
MRTQIFRTEGSGPRDLIVWLPGRGDTLQAFAENGLVDLLRERDLPVDVVVTEAHLGYYADRSLQTRIEQDILGPAAPRGYRHVWFVGDSMGGLGTLLYASTHPGVVRGIVLLGPYLGAKQISQEVAKSGGLDAWHPLPPAPAEWERQIWEWLRDRAMAGSASIPQVWLGYGLQDRFAYEQGVLAKALPGDRVIAISGGHDWKTWREAFRQLLDQGAFMGE